MHKKRLIFLGPALIATLIFGVTESSQASVVTASGNTVTSVRGTEIVNALAPPVCKRMGRRLARTCTAGYNEGYNLGAQCSHRRYGFRPSRSDRAYNIGFRAGNAVGRSTC